MRLRTSLIALAFIGTAACSGASGETDDHTSTEGTEEVGCQSDPRALSPIVGASATSLDGAVKVSVASVDPEVPARGNNHWEVVVTDRAGAPLVDASISVQPFMPDHGHGSPSPAVVESLGEGRYRLSPLNFSMPGLWEVRLGVTPAGGAKSMVTLGACVTG